MKYEAIDIKEDITGKAKNSYVPKKRKNDKFSTHISLVKAVSLNDILSKESIDNDCCIEPKQKKKSLLTLSQKHSNLPYIMTRRKLHKISSMPKLKSFNFEIEPQRKKESHTNIEDYLNKLISNRPSSKYNPQISNKKVTIVSLNQEPKVTVQVPQEFQDIKKVEKLPLILNNPIIRYIFFEKILNTLTHTVTFVDQKNKELYTKEVINLLRTEIGQVIKFAGKIKEKPLISKGIEIKPEFFFKSRSSFSDYDEILKAAKYYKKLLLERSKAVSSDEYEYYNNKISEFITQIEQKGKKGLVEMMLEVQKRFSRMCEPLEKKHVEFLMSTNYEQKFGDLGEKKSTFGDKKNVYFRSIRKSESYKGFDVKKKKLDEMESEQNLFRGERESLVSFLRQNPSEEEIKDLERIYKDSTPVGPFKRKKKEEKIIISLNQHPPEEEKKTTPVLISKQKPIIKKEERRNLSISNNPSNSDLMNSTAETLKKKTISITNGFANHKKLEKNQTKQKTFLPFSKKNEEKTNFSSLNDLSIIERKEPIFNPKRESISQPKVNFKHKKAFHPKHRVKVKLHKKKRQSKIYNNDDLPEKKEDIVKEADMKDSVDNDEREESRAQYCAEHSEKTKEKNLPKESEEEEGNVIIFTEKPEEEEAQTPVSSESNCSSLSLTQLKINSPKVLQRRNAVLELETKKIIELYEKYLEQGLSESFISKRNEKRLSGFDLKEHRDSFFFDDIHNVDEAEKRKKYWLLKFGNDINYGISVGNLTENEKTFFEKFRERIENLKAFDDEAYVDFLEKNFSYLQEELEIIRRIRKDEMRINKFVETLNEDRENFKKKQNEKAMKCRVIDKKVITDSSYPFVIKEEKISL